MTKKSYRKKRSHKAFLMHLDNHAGTVKLEELYGNWTLRSSKKSIIPSKLGWRSWFNGDDVPQIGLVDDSGRVDIAFDMISTMVMPTVIL